MLTFLAKRWVDLCLKGGARRCPLSPRVIIFRRRALTVNRRRVYPRRTWPVTHLTRSAYYCYFSLSIRPSRFVCVCVYLCM